MHARGAGETTGLQGFHDCIGRRREHLDQPDDPAERRKRLGEFKQIVSDLKVKNVRFMPGEHDASLDYEQAGYVTSNLVRVDILINHQPVEGRSVDILGNALRQAAETAGRTIRLRIHVTSLDAMCRMIHNGLGVGVMPQRAFELMHGVGALESVPLSDAWAQRELRLIARDFSSLPVTARLLVEHLQQSHEPDERLAA